MSRNCFVEEVKALQELGVTHTGLIYALGIARATTTLKLSIMLKVLRELPGAECSDVQIMQVSEALSRGKMGEAKALIAEFKAALSGETGEMCRSTQYDMLREVIGRNADFNEQFEANGKVFARNPSTGEVLSSEQAEILRRKSQEALQQVEQEERPKSVDPNRLSRCFSDGPSFLLGPDNSELTCDICGQPIPEEDLLPLDSCGHLLHAACILDHIKFQVQSMIFPATCPLSNCRIEISTLDLQERLSPDDLALYEQNSFRYYVEKHTGDMLSCPTPDCSYVFSWSGESSEFRCPLCNKSYCLTCRTEWHTHLTCEQLQLRSEVPEVDLAYEYLAHNKRFKQCSYCLFWVVKPGGSNKLLCRCGYRFCFKCGEALHSCSCRRPMSRFLSNITSLFKRRKES